MSSSRSSWFGTLRNDRWTLTILAVAFFLLYRIGDGHNYEYADDSWPNVVRFSFGPPTDVHHIIPKIIYEICRVGGVAVENDVNRSATVLKSYVAVMSSLALLLVGLLTLRWFRNVTASVIAMCAVGFTYGYWSYSIVPDFYVPAVTFVLLAVYFADKSYDVTRGSAWWWLALSALSVLFASFNHQAYSLSVLAIALVLAFSQRRDLSPGLRLERTVIFLGGTAVLGFAAYYAVYLMSPRDKSFFVFVQGYAAWMKMLPYDRFQILTPVYAGIGIVRSLAFPEYALRFESAYVWVQNHFGLKGLFDEVYLMRNVGYAALAGLVILTAVVVSSIAGAAGMTVRSVWRVRPRAPGYWMIVIWVAFQSVFFCLWEAASNEFWIWLVPCLGLLIVGPLLRGNYSKVARATPWFIVAMLFASSSVVVTKYWDADNCIYQVNKRYLSRLDNRDLAIIVALYPSQYIHYMYANHPRTFSLNSLSDGSMAVSVDKSKLMSELERVRIEGGRVFLDPMVVMPERAEANILQYHSGASASDLASCIQEVESSCRREQIPLYAVVRKGGGVVKFEKHEFQGEVPWVDETLKAVASVDKMRR
jgi:hypothetical protein